MKVSSISNNKGIIATNMSNEFVETNLNDGVPYKVIMKNLSEANQIAEKFVNKDRVVREKTSLGGFRIPSETLKKRVNPSAYMEEFPEEEYRPEKNPAVNSFSFNPYKNRPVQKNGPIDLAEPLVDDNLTYDPEKDLGTNLLEIIEKQVDSLKRESEEQQKMIELSRTAKLKSAAQVEENKVITDYIHHNPDRIQAIKHVQTNFKPEYMSLEELQKLKEEHAVNMKKIEEEFYEKKRRDEVNTSRLSKITQDDRYNKLQKMESKHIENRISPDELNDIIKHEEDYFNQNKKEKKSMQTRALSARVIKRNNSKPKNVPLNKDEEKFVKKYANYKMKKSTNYAEVEDELQEDSTSLWNKTRIKSLHKNGVVSRPDGLPGHLDKEDYSLYYLSIASDTPKSLSIKSISHSRSHSKKRLRKTSQNKYRPSTTKNKNSTKIPSTMNSHLAFIKLIFNLLDKEKSGKIQKTEIAANMNLEANILLELGFESDAKFIECLNKFPSAITGYMTEQELIALFLSRSELADEYLTNYKNFNEENNMKEENNYNFNNYAIEDRVNQEVYQGLPSNRMDFLNYASTEEKLEKLKESLNESQIGEYNKKLTSKLKNKIHKGNDKNSKKTQSTQVNVNYKDYRNFLNKYKTKNSLNFTIPKPFNFLKKDYEGKKLKKIEEILEERKRKEDEILGYRFKPNELKREIFISNFENVIEAERENRRIRTEKLKEKIVQNMKPFSFYEQDERRYKEKIERQYEVPQFPAFKANAVKWTSQVNIYDDVMKKMDEERKARIEQRKMETAKAAKLPPRMEMHEKKKIQQEEEKKLMEKTQRSTKRSKSFKANPVKDFAKAHESFISQLEKKKSLAKPTEPVPFNFHEPKKKASLRSYLDNENDPQKNNPKFKNNIVDIIKKIQQKPKIEPASTKALNLLMGTRRKELEEKQRKEEEKILEDKLRKEKQDRLKERVINSKALVDNSKALEEKRSKAQEDFKRNLQEKKQNYQQELARRLQRVYNKPLMFEQSAKTEKFNMNKNIKDKLNDIIYSKEEESINENQQGFAGNEDNLYDEKLN